MENLINSLGTGVGSSVSWLAANGVLFMVFAGIWIGFGFALVRSQGTLQRAWTRIRALPLVVQLVLCLLFLPVMAGLWIWVTTWPLVVRAVLVVGIAGWNLLVFLPQAAQPA